MHPGGVCLATMPLAQNHSPLQRRKHPFACHLPQKPFDHEFSSPRRAQFLPMIPSLPLNLSRTLPYPPLFSLIQRTFSYPPLCRPLPSPSFPSARRSPYSLDVLLLLLFSPSSLHTLLVHRKLYHPPNAFTVRRTFLLSAERYTFHLASFPTF